MFKDRSVLFDAAAVALLITAVTTFDEGEVGANTILFIALTFLGASRLSGDASLTSIAGYISTRMLAVMAILVIFETVVSEAFAGTALGFVALVSMVIMEITVTYAEKIITKNEEK